MFFTIDRKNDSLPEEGWIHQCIYCENPTSMIEKVYKRHICICNKCSKKYDKRTKYNYINNCLVSGILKKIMKNE